MSAQEQSGEPPTTSLHTLSNEVISMIVASARPEDLPALRLTCKQLHGNSTKHFATAFTIDVKLMISVKSLQAMIGIAGHPVYGPLVRSITIDTVGFLVEQSDYWAPKDLLYPKCMRIVYDQASLKKSGKATSMLTKALVTLNASGNDISLGVGDHLGEDTSLVVRDHLETPIGRRSFWDFLDHDDKHYFWQCDRDFVLKLLFDAAKNSRYNVRSFNIQTSTEGIDSQVDSYPEDIGTITLNNQRKRTLAGVCRNFRVLQFSFKPSWMDLAADTVEGLSRLISLSSNVKDLTLHLGSDCFLWEVFCAYPGRERVIPAPQEGVFYDLAAATATLELEILRLLHVIGSYTEFEELFQEHCKTLKTLELTGCILWGVGSWDTESWSRLLRFLLENMHLSQLKIQGMSVGGDYMREEHDDHCEWFGEWNMPKDVGSDSISISGEHEIGIWLSQEVDRLAEKERLHREAEMQHLLKQEADRRADGWYS